MLAAAGALLGGLIDSAITAGAEAFVGAATGAVETVATGFAEDSLALLSRIDGAVIDSTVERYAARRFGAFAASRTRGYLNQFGHRVRYGVPFTVRARKKYRSSGSRIFQFRETNTMPYRRYRRRGGYRRRRGKSMFVNTPGEPAITKTHISTYLPVIISPKVQMVTSEKKLFPSILNFVKSAHSPDVMASSSVIHSFIFPTCHIESLPEMCGLATYVSNFNTYEKLSEDVSSQASTKYVMLPNSPLKCCIFSLRFDVSVTYPVTLPVVNARLICGLLPVGRYPHIPKADDGNESNFYKIGKLFFSGEKVEYTLPKFYGNLSAKSPGFVKICSKSLNIGSPVLFSGAAPAYQKCERRTFFSRIRRPLYFRSYADMHRLNVHGGLIPEGYQIDTIFTTLSPNSTVCYVFVMFVLCDKLFEPHENVLNGAVIPQNDKARFAFAVQPVITTRFKFYPTAKPVARFGNLIDKEYNFAQDGGFNRNSTTAITLFKEGLLKHELYNSAMLPEGFYPDPKEEPIDNNEIKNEDIPA